MMRIPPFTKGPAATVKKMNEIIDAVNSLLNMSGDGMVKVKRTPIGIALSISPQMINQRIPKPGGGANTKIAFCKTDPNATTVIQAFLDTDLTGQEVEVSFMTVGNVGVGLNSMVPRLSLGQKIMVISISDVWYCTTIFQESRNC